MGFSQGERTVSLEDILSRVGEYDILSHYLGISNIPCFINSPLRKDERPSFGLYSHDGEKIRFKDFSNGDRGDTFDLLSQKWKTSFDTTLKIIHDDLENIESKGLTKLTKLNTTRCKRTYDTNTKLECKVKPWKKHDLEYWESYGISLPWLKFGDIYSISHAIITKGKNRYEIASEKYAYVYVERKDGKVSLKIYQPFSKTYKWSNNHDSSVWDLWTKLPAKGKKLIITSSRKDALCCWENTGIPSVSLQAESNLPKKHVIQQLKDRYNQIYVLYDNDFDSETNPGRLLGKGLAEKFDLIQIEIPESYQSKDPSDLAFNHGRKVVRDVISILIKD